MALRATAQRRFAADLISTERFASIAERRLDLALTRASQSTDKIVAFEEMVFGDSHSFATAFNEGRLTFRDAMKLIDQSKKFRQWTVGMHPDASLIDEYHRAMAKETIWGKLPGKSVRFAAFSGAGIAIDAVIKTPGFGTAAGVALSAFDTFVIDNVVRGWRPNMFVDQLTRKVRAK